MLILRKLESALKNKYNIAVGQKTLKDAKRNIDKLPKMKIKISGRSYTTGKKKVLTIPAKALFNT